MTATERAVERTLDRLSAAQVEALAATVERLPKPPASGGGLTNAVTGARPSAIDAVAALAAAWAGHDGLTGAGVALALRGGLRTREAAMAAAARPVWTGPGADGEERLTAGVLHELVHGARRSVLLVSYAAHTLPMLAVDLEAAVARGCAVDVVFETEADSAGAFSSWNDKPFAAVPGIRRWRWPASERASGAVLHAKALIIDGSRALVGSANLTQRALSQNIEVGLLVRDAAVAAALERHVRELMETRILVEGEG